jgi:hypothetical protein
MSYPFVNRRGARQRRIRDGIGLPVFGLATLRSLKVGAPDLADDDV